VGFPRVVRAISIGPAAFKALRAGTEGQVHSVFERAFNILIEGELVGIGCSDIFRSPINLITDIPPSSPSNKEVEARSKTLGT